MDKKDLVREWIANNINNLDDVDTIDHDAKKRVEELKRTLGPCHEECDTPEKRVACYFIKQYDLVNRILEE